jgi:hypothetical protein
MLTAFMLLCLFSSSGGIEIRIVKNGANFQTATEKIFSENNVVARKDVRLV